MTTTLYTGWQLAARSSSPIPIGKGLHLVYPQGARVVVAIAPLMPTEQLPDSQRAYAYLDGQTISVVGGTASLCTSGIPLEPPPAGSAWTDLVVGRLGDGLGWGVRTATQCAQFEGLDIGTACYAYVWLEKSYQSVSTIMPLVDITDWMPSHALAGAVSARSEVRAQLRVDGSVYLSAAVMAQSRVSMARSLRGGVVATSRVQVSGTERVPRRPATYFLRGALTPRSAVRASMSAGGRHALHAVVQARSQLRAAYPTLFVPGIARTMQARLRLPPVTGQWADRLVFALRGSLPAATAQIGFTRVPVDTTVVAGIDSFFAPVWVHGMWLWQGQPLSIQGASLPVTGRASDSLIFDVRASARPAVGSWEQDLGVVLSVDFMQMQDTWDFVPQYAMALGSGMTMVDEIRFITRDASILPEQMVSVTDLVTLVGQYQVGQSESAGVADLWAFRDAQAPAPRAEDRAVWAVNTDTMASSRYTNYAFNSFFARDGVYYGVAEDGIYRLDADNDAGVAIDAALDTGTQDFNLARNKYLPHVYVGYRSTEPVAVDVIADGVTRTYQAPSSTQTLDVRRVDCGKGVKANYWGITVRNQYGAMFELDSVRLAPILTLRRM